MLKGASGYVGAGRLHLICTNIKIFYKRDEFEKMIDWYPIFIESCIETKRWIRSYIASQDDKKDKPPYVEEQSALEVEIADSFRL